MRHPILSRSIGCLLFWWFGIQPAKSNTESTLPLSTITAESGTQAALPVERTVQIEVDFLEFESTPDVPIPERFAAKQTTLPTVDAENLVQLFLRGGLAKLRSQQRTTIRLGKVTEVSEKELKTSNESDPFADSGVTVFTGSGPHKFTMRTVGAELNLLLVSASPEPIKIDATLQQTCFEGFVEYGGTQIDVTRTDGKPTKVTVPSGFYQPVFSSASREEKLSLRTGETVVLRVDWTDCKTGEDYSTRPIPAPEGFQSKYAQPSKTSKPMLILLRLRSDP